MPFSKYLIVGSSHAALEAVTAIRLQDEAGSIAMLTRDSRLPYSPTILPYIVSGRSRPDNVMLRDAAWFTQNGVTLQRNAEVVGVDPLLKSVRTAAGEIWTYDKLLLATGGTPMVPPVPGLADVRLHVLHTMDDAIGLRDAIAGGKSAIVLGSWVNASIYAAGKLLAPNPASPSQSVTHPAAHGTKIISARAGPCVNERLPIRASAC